MLAETLRELVVLVLAGAAGLLLAAEMGGVDAHAEGEMGFGGSGGGAVFVLAAVVVDDGHSTVDAGVEGAVGDGEFVAFGGG